MRTLLTLLLVVVAARAQVWKPEANNIVLNTTSNLIQIQQLQLMTEGCYKSFRTNVIATTNTGSLRYSVRTKSSFSDNWWQAVFIFT